MQTYTNKLVEVLSSNVSQLSNFIDKSPLYQANLGLWTKILSDTQSTNIQITIPSETSIAELYESILWATILSKYAQNLSCNSTVKEFKIDDRLYYPKKDKNKDKIYRFRGVDGDKIRLVDKDSFIYRSISDLNKMFILNSQNTLTCHTTTNFRKYYDDFQSSFPNVDVLTRFSKKTVIVVSKELINTTQRKTLPIRYNLDKDTTCLVEPLIEVVNDFSTIENLLWSENHGIEEVIFLGKNKYKEVFLDAIRHQDYGRIKKVILLGEQPISTDYQFRSWHWTTKELFFLKKSNEKYLTLHPINSSKVLEFVSKYNAFTEKLISVGANSEYTRGVMYQYLSYFLILPLINSENSPLILFLEKLNSGSSDFEIILDNAHIDATPYITELRALLTELHELLTTLNPKLETIKSLANNKSIKATYIVVKSKRSAEELGKIIEGIKGVTVLTHQVLRAYLKSPKENGIFNQEGNLRRNHFIFTHLHLDHDPKKRNPLAFYKLYEETLQYGLATVLYYDGIEENRVNKISFFAQQQALRHLSHPDRSYFVGDLLYKEPITLKDIDIPTVEATQEVLTVIEAGFNATEESSQEDYTIKLNDYFAKYFGEYRKVGKNKFAKIEADEDDAEELESTYYSKRTLKNDTKFEITFDDKSSITLYATQKVACKATNGDNIIGVKVEELKKSDKLVDFEITFDNSSAILETIPEVREDIIRIQKASKLWREWLNYSLENYKQIHKLTYDEACKKLTEKLAVSVSEATVRLWLKNKDKYYFPRTIDDLDKILDLRIRTIESQKEEMKQKARQIRESRNMSASFKEVITQLKIELGNYLIAKEKGSILSHINVQSDIKKLLNNQQFKSIIKIEKL